ncbi:MAG: hypothetical protein CXT73_05615 [Methanobacteriota archaeon]|nr:MAG: hypothetical protein CXT73_05615 [Euryarchaeota archaeon]
MLDRYIYMNNTKNAYEIYINNTWIEIILLNKDDLLDGINEIPIDKKYDQLEEKVFGKYLKNKIQGYNPIGWWEYGYVDKKTIRYTSYQ